jgi:putative flavoprotein involved in K+ transport
MITPMSYRSPDQLGDRGVLVVGAAATGVQLAEEIQRSGRQVTLSVGEHVRMPRRYRGRDVFWWMHVAGVLDQSTADVDDIRRARRLASPQLVGTAPPQSINLNSLQELGVRLVGRFAYADGQRAQFSGSLANVCALADLKANRLLGTFDEWALTADLDADISEPERVEPTQVGETPLEIDLTSGEIGTILWATGFQPDYSWLDLPVLDRKGKIKHDDGVITTSPGAYVMGLTFLRRRGSSFIAGAERDSLELAAHLVDYLAGR